MRNRFTFLSGVVVCAVLVSAVRGEDDSKSFNAWNESQFVFTGKLLKVTAGPVGRSLPPVYTHRLEFKVDQVLRGELKAGATIVVSHVARQEKRPTFPEDEDCLVAASLVRRNMQAAHVEVATAEKLMDISLACSLPLGWKVMKGKPVSPWAELGEKAWPDSELKSNLVCSVTGRPAFLNGDAIKLTVEKVPPVKEIKWTNPDGDGEYKITVTNTSDEVKQLKSLFTDGKEILWSESLVVLCQGKTYPLPSAKGVSENAKHVELKAGESITTVVNALKLKGPEWPRGGYRIAFQFCLGEASQTMSFYYMSRHHDKIRAKFANEKE